MTTNDLVKVSKLKLKNDSIVWMDTLERADTIARSTPVSFSPTSFDAYRDITWWVWNECKGEVMMQFGVASTGAKITWHFSNPDEAMMFRLMWDQ